MKHVHIGVKAHTKLKKYCKDRGLKLSFSVDKVIETGLQTLIEKEKLEQSKA